jgi:hypothetical protein
MFLLMHSKRVFCLLLGLTVLPFLAKAQSGVRINEVLANNVSIQSSDFTISDWVELYNPNSQAIDLADASLTDKSSEPRKWVFPPGSVIPTNGYLVVLLDSSRPATTNTSAVLNTGFSVKAGGDDLSFFAKGASGPLLDSVVFGLQAGDLSIGRIGNDWKATQPTPGSGNVEQSLGDVSTLKVNEWMASPSSGEDWFELFNSGSLPLSLSGLYLTDTLDNKTNSLIPPLSFIGTDLNGYARIWADSNPEDGADHANFKLSGGGENIGIFTGQGTQIDAITYGQQTADVSEGRLPDGTGNIVSFPNSSTPGAPNVVEFQGIWVNELLSHTDPPLEDAVEFYNWTDAPIDVSRWYLSNSKTKLRRYQLPANTIIQPKGFLVVYEKDFNGPNALDPFTFNSAHGDQVYLAQADSRGFLTGYLVSETFESAQNGVSFGRYQTSVPGDYKFVAMSSRTFGMDNPTTLEEFRTGQGESNSAPRVGPIVLNEIMFEPPPNGALDNTADEFIELRNITGNSVPLYDPNAVTNQWKLRDALSFTFPAGSAMSPFSYALVVPFDPNVDTAQRDAFRSKYDIPAQTPIFGPWSGKLNNSGDSVEFYKPDPPQLPPHPDAGFVPYIRVDKVNFLSSAPWPSGAEGTGNSLQRKNSSAFGNDPINWQTGVPTPGRPNSPELLDTDADGMPDQWEDLNGFDKNNPADASSDFDGDGYSNLAEYIAGTDPRNAESRLEVVQVTRAAGDSSPATISFRAEAGKTYSVQYRNSLLPSTTWQTAGNVDGISGVATFEDADAAGHEQRFYRIVTPAVE